MTTDESNYLVGGIILVIIGFALFSIGFQWLGYIILFIGAALIFGSLL